jgi:hypothetical protein
MPISWSLHAEKRLVYLTVTRPYTRDQGRAVMRAMTAHPEFVGGFGFVVELIGRGDSAFTRDMLYFLATYKETFRNSRIAIVVTLCPTAEAGPRQLFLQTRPLSRSKSSAGGMWNVTL